MGFGIELKRLLKVNKKTVAWLAEKTGIPVNSLYTMIKRDSNPKVESLFSIASALDVHVDELLRCIPGADNMDIYHYNDGFIFDFENQLIQLYRQLNEEGRDIVMHTAEGLVATDKYKKDNQFVDMAVEA
jgi:transcriptional regulator with XRE-family HTH domain